MFPHHGSILKQDLNKLNKEDKLLILPHNAGMNDFFSTIAYAINIFANNKLPFSNIYCCNRTYEDLRNYFKFENINYVHEDDELIFLKNSNVRLLRDHFPGWTNKVIAEELFLTNFINFRNDVYDKIKQHHCKIGIHLRHKLRECGKNQEQIAQETILYKQNLSKFLKENSNKKCYISSDYFGYLEEFIDNKNVVARTSQECTSILQSRKKDTINVIEDLINLSSCDKIYYTSGFFIQLVQTFSNHEIEYSKLVNVPA